MTTAPRLQLEHVAMQFAGVDGGAPAIVLKDVNLAAAAGESLAIIGPSGCGKSTLLNIIGTLDRPTSGKVILDNTNLATLTDNQLAALRSQKIGFIFQDHHLLPQCTVLENVLIPRSPPTPRAPNPSNAPSTSSTASDWRTISTTAPASFPAVSGSESHSSAR